MTRISLILCGLALGACLHEVAPDGADDPALPDDPADPTAPADPADAPAPASADPDATDPDAADERTGPVPDDTLGDDVPTGEGEGEVPGDDDGDGVVHVDEPGPNPADAHEACSAWTDCGPHYDDANSGFDCVDSTCRCDATGQWSQACADIGGQWSSFECFCFTDTDAMPSTLATPPASADDDVSCWWTWKWRYCDPDQWVDTSYYERVCDSRGCWDEYVEDGYYVDGECYGRWIKRCTDGNEYWY